MQIFCDHYYGTSIINNNIKIDTKSKEYQKAHCSIKNKPGLEDLKEICEDNNSSMSIAELDSKKVHEKNILSSILK